MAKLILLLTLAILTGCVAGTPQQARLLGPEKRYSMQIDENYQTVYRRIVDVARTCYQVNLVTASQIVNADLYSDTRTATISVGMYGALGPQLYQLIDLKAIDDTHTTIDAVYPLGRPDLWGQKLRGWAAGTSAAC